MKAWLKTGLIGGLILGIVTIIGTFSYKLPETVIIGLFLSCFNLCTFILLYPLIGVVAVAWDPSKPESIDGAKLGALAGLIAGIIDGVFTVISAVINIFVGGSEYLISNIPREAITPFQERMYEAVSSPVYILSGAIIGSLFSILFAVGLGALGGFLFSTFINKKEAVVK